MCTQRIGIAARLYRQCAHFINQAIAECDSVRSLIRA